MSTARALLLILAACVASISGAACADPAGIAARRAVIGLEQQSESFALQLSQSQQKLFVSGEERRRLDARHLEQQHQQDILQQDELSRVIPGNTAQPRPQGYDRARFERERSAQRFGFETQPASWGPTLGTSEGWTPTAERARRPWAPTLE